MILTALARLLGLDKAVVTAALISFGIVAIFGAGVAWKYRVEQAAIAAVKAKESADAVKRAEEAIAKSREFQRRVDDGADVDCLLFKNGWLSGPMPVSCK